MGLFTYLRRLRLGRKRRQRRLEEWQTERPKSVVGIVRGVPLTEVPPARARQLIEDTRGGVLSGDDADALVAKLDSGAPMAEVMTELAAKVKRGGRARRRQRRLDEDRAH